LEKLEEWETDPTWNNPPVAAPHHYHDEEKTLIESDIAQHLVTESDLNFVKMHLLNDSSDHICQPGNVVNASSEHPV